MRISYVSEALKHVYQIPGFVLITLNVCGVHDTPDFDEVDSLLYWKSG